MDQSDDQKGLWEECRPDLVRTDFILLLAVTVGVAAVTAFYSRSVVATLFAGGAIVALGAIAVIGYMFVKVAGWVGGRAGELIYDAGVALSQNGRRVVSQPATIVVVLLSGMLLWALADHDYAYYEFLRVVACPSLAYFAWLAASRQLPGWAFAFGFGALLYNPFASPGFEREVWSVVNLLTIAALVTFAIRTRDPAK